MPTWFLAPSEGLKLPTLGSVNVYKYGLRTKMVSQCIRTVHGLFRCTDVCLKTVEIVQKMYIFKFSYPDLKKKFLSLATFFYSLSLSVFRDCFKNEDQKSPR
jgi:hypothetical protein